MKILVIYIICNSVINLVNTKKRSHKRSLNFRKNNLKKNKEEGSEEKVNIFQRDPSIEEKTGPVCPKGYLFSKAFPYQNCTGDNRDYLPMWRGDFWTSYCCEKDGLSHKVETCEAKGLKTVNINWKNCPMDTTVPDIQGHFKFKDGYRVQGDKCCYEENWSEEYINWENQGIFISYNIDFEISTETNSTTHELYQTMMKTEIKEKIVKATDKLWNWVFYGCEGKIPKYAATE